MLTRWKRNWVSNGSPERSEMSLPRFTKKRVVASLSGPCDSTATGWNSRLQTIQCIWHIFCQQLFLSAAVPVVRLAASCMKQPSWRRLWHPMPKVYLCAMEKQCNLNALPIAANQAGWFFLNWNVCCTEGAADTVIQGVLLLLLLLFKIYRVAQLKWGQLTFLTVTFECIVKTGSYSQKFYYKLKG